MFQGIPASPLGFELSHAVEVTELPAAEVEQLAAHDNLADGINANSRAEAEAIVQQMREDLQAAQQQQAPPRGRAGGEPAGRAGRRGDVTKLRRAPRRASRCCILALAVSIGAFAFAGLGLRQKLPTELVGYAVLLAAGYLAGWAVVRWTARGADPVLLPTAAILGGLGVAMLYRIMVDRGEPQIWKEQAVWLGVGLIVFVLVLVIIRDIRQLDAYTYTLGLAGVVLLLLPIVPGVGYEINGARLWAHVGSVSFQPAEFGKILIVIFLASYLSSKRELLASGVGPLGMPRAKDLGPLVLAWGASLAVLFLERDMGASLLFFGVFVVMIWVASGRPGYLVVGWCCSSRAP